MLEIGFGLLAEAKVIIDAVDQVLKEGYRTGDIADDTTKADQILGTKEMGQLVLKYIAQHIKSN